MIKILSWNIQGYSGLLEHHIILRDLLLNGNYDLLCIQEAGTILGSFDTGLGCVNDVYLYQHNSIHPTALNNYYALYYPYQRCINGNNRCSMVTYVKKSHYISCYRINTGGWSRDALCTVCHNATIANIHLTSGIPDQATKEYQRIKDSLNGNYIIVGDYNINYFERKVDNPLYSIGIATQQRGGCLDYLYTNIKYPGIVIRVVHQFDTYSDHSAIEYIINNI